MGDSQHGMHDRRKWVELTGAPSGCNLLLVLGPAGTNAPLTSQTSRRRARDCPESLGRQFEPFSDSVPFQTTESYPKEPLTLRPANHQTRERQPRWFTIFGP